MTDARMTTGPSTSSKVDPRPITLSLKPKAVIVEDNRLIALDLQELLAHDLGCDVRVVCTTATDAIATISDFQPDLVISDLSILLRDHMTPTHITGLGRKVVVITGDDDAADRYRGDSFELITKPFSNGQVIRVVEDLVGGMRKKHA
jgi:DNA-binding NtrC family response regulator